jgi:hypothetical protein
MPRTAITPQQVTAAGLAPAYEPANVDGNSVGQRGHQALHVKNASAAAVTVTLPTPGQVSGLDIADRTVSVPAGGERLISTSSGVLRHGDGTVQVNYSAVASVTVAVLEA